MNIREILIGEGVLRPAGSPIQPAPLRLADTPVLRLDEAGKRAAARHMRERRDPNAPISNPGLSDVIALVKFLHRKSA